MDKEVIERKLESLRRCIARIQEKCPPDAGVLARNFDLQDIFAIARLHLDDFRKFAEAVARQIQ